VQPSRETTCTRALNPTSRQNKLQNRGATCKSTGHTSRFYFLPNPPRVYPLRVLFRDCVKIPRGIHMQQLTFARRTIWDVGDLPRGENRKPVYPQICMSSMYTSACPLSVRIPNGIFRITTNKPSPSVKLNMKLVCNA